MAQAGGSRGGETFERRAAPATRRGEWGSRRGTERWKWARWRSVSAGTRPRPPQKPDAAGGAAPTRCVLPAHTRPRESVRPSVAATGDE